jgi:hypothetical protein
MKNMTTITSFLLLILFSVFNVACKKDTVTVCENLLEQGIADSNNLSGKWKLECFGTTANGNKIKCNEKVELEIILEFEDGKVTSKVYNEISGTYQVSSQNSLSITASDITFIMVHDPLEGEFIDAINTAQCFVIKENNTLIIHYKHSINKSSNILKFKKQ